MSENYKKNPQFATKMPIKLCNHIVAYCFVGNIGYVFLLKCWVIVVNIDIYVDCDVVVLKRLLLSRKLSFWYNL